MRRILAFLAFSWFFIALQPASAASNLVVNGDFESGNTGFTSGYSYSPGGNGSEGQYTVRSDPYPWNGYFVSVGDHTTGTGQMFVGNGAPQAGQIVRQSGAIAIASATDYFFEAFVMNVCCVPNYPGSIDAPILRFSVSLDGDTPTVLDTLTIPLTPPGIWYGLSTTFNSGGATSAVLSLVNANTAVGGNDFAVDDISESTVPPAVPEPSSWAMLLAGFAAIGAGMRRRPALDARALANG